MNPNTAHDPRNPRFVRSFETQQIVQALEQLKPGDTLTYADIAALIGRQSVEGAYRPLVAARRIVERDRQDKTFGTTHGVGVRCLLDDEIVKTGHATRATIRRRAMRGLDRMARTRDLTALPLALQNSFCAHAAILAAVADQTSDAAARKLETTAPGVSLRGLLAEIVDAKTGGAA